MDENQVSGRRRFVRKLVSLAALGGVAGLLLGERVGTAYAANSAVGLHSAIAGGDGNSTFDDYNFIGGGQNNQAGNNDGNTTTATHATVGGGETNLSSASHATVAGGLGNGATDKFATVGGGNTNQASAIDATVSGGSSNTASGVSSTIGGGHGNFATGGGATVPGGQANVAAGNFSFATGHRARVGSTPGTHNGTFLFADANDFDFNSVGGNEFAARATGGVRFVTGLTGTSGAPDAFKTFVMTNAGNLGVGLNSPARAIHLQGNNAAFRMDRDVNSSAFILVRTAPGDFSTIWKTFYVGVDASGVNNGSFFIGDVGNNVGGASTKRLIIDNSGNVGLGRTPSANRLEVEGTASKTVAGSWLANSDMNIKTNIQDLEDPLGVIEKLHPVRFQYTQEYRAKHPSIKDHPYYNFIAQEYRQVFPDSVQDDGEGLLQMDSHNVLPYLVRAVQELTIHNETLGKQNEMLCKQSESLSKQNEMLNKRIEALEEGTGKTSK